MNAANIQENMEVIGFCGGTVGTVDHVEGTSIKLSKDRDEGRSYYIPMTWVDSVDAQVHINRTCRAARREWETAELITVV